MDQRSRYPVMAVTSSTSAMSPIKILTQVFSQYGLPLKIISDNGPPFTSYELKSYSLKHSIHHQKITPLWSQANGEIERFMQPFTKVIRAAYMERNVNIGSLLFMSLYLFTVWPRIFQLIYHQLIYCFNVAFVIPSQMLIINLITLT